MKALEFKPHGVHAIRKFSIALVALAGTQSQAAAQRVTSPAPMFSGKQEVHVITGGSAKEHLESGDPGSLKENRNIAWGARVSSEFKSKTIEVAGSSGCSPGVLMSIFALETGERFTATVKNGVSGATGLIQFLPRTAIALGTTVDELADMRPEDQLIVVGAYFAQFEGRLVSPSDCYMAVLWPAAISKPEETILFQRPSRAYTQNAGLDRDNDGAVTKREATTKVEAMLMKGMRADNRG